LFHHRRWAGFGGFLEHGEVAQDGIVEFESMLQLSHHSLIGFDVDAQVVRLGQLVDLVRQLAAAPVFHAMNFATGRGNHALVTLQHSWNLLALVRMDQQDDLVMTHKHPQRQMWCSKGEPSIICQSREVDFS
jgi:hypothetical protein